MVVVSFRALMSFFLSLSTMALEGLTDRYQFHLIQHSKFNSKTHQSSQCFFISFSFKAQFGCNLESRICRFKLTGAPKVMPGCRSSCCLILMNRWMPLGWNCSCLFWFFCLHLSLKWGSMGLPWTLKACKILRLDCRSAWVTSTWGLGDYMRQFCCCKECSQVNGALSGGQFQKLMVALA